MYKTLNSTQCSRHSFWVFALLLLASIGATIVGPGVRAQTVRTIAVDDLAEFDADLGCTLREAVELANAAQLSGLGCNAMEAGSGQPVEYVIELPAYVHLLTGSAAEDGNQQGDLDIQGNITVIGEGMTSTIIDGQFNDRLFHVLNSNAVLHLEDITLRNGTVSETGDFLLRRGGAVLVEDGTLSVSRVRFSNNRAIGSISSGGAIMNQAGTINIVHSEFIDNATNERGGAVASVGSPVVGTDQVDITNTLFTGNSARLGGAISVGSDTGIANLDRVIVVGNSAEGSSSGGGGIQRGIFGNGIVQPMMNIRNSQIVSNTTDGNGGGISGLDFNIANTSVFFNMAAGDGGGMSIGNARLSHVSVVGNTANSDGMGGGSGGGIFRITETELKNSILAANISGSGTDCQGSITSLGYNIIGANDGCIGSFPPGVPNSNDDFVGTIGLPLDPGINTALQSQPVVLLQTSIAIDAIPGSVCSYLSAGINPFFSDGDPVTDDQRRVVRGPFCDIGAFELLVNISPLADSETTEEGGFAQIAMSLARQPTQGVTIPLEVDGDEVTLSVNSVTFTPSNWNQQQTFDVIGLNDDVDDGDQAWVVRLLDIISDDAGFFGVDPPDLSGVNLDNDSAGITVAPISELATTEAGQSVEIDFLLNTQPENSVTVALESSNESEGIVSPGTLVFDASNWQVLQTVVITGVDDERADGDSVFTVVIAVDSTDTPYDGFPVADLSITNIDDDVAGINTPAEIIQVSKLGSSQDLDFSLSSEPESEVSLLFSVSSSLQANLNPTRLDFDADNWNNTQTITVTGLDDGLAGDVAFSIIAEILTQDSSYLDLTPISLQAVNRSELLFLSGFE